ncbi:MAG: ComEC/Rec2 family competence protein [Romboutsia timonensis]|uniref:ComEC/Rec2 family competence protein n=1 Tax=Romboutsia timonensis TaxID=1776391 RepID=UPI002A760463|nr:ComEC/Rec2 family competence protein [Romboutsia timonensis]MDY3000801.1 ComEC/Rec2 family competence protein [Romboutsia timonensis]
MRRPFLIIFIILLIVSFIYTNTNAINTDYGNEDIEIIGIVKYKKEKERYNEYIVGKFVVRDYTKYKKIKVGSEIKLTGKFKDLNKMSYESFDYGRYLRSMGYKGLIYLKDYSIVGNNLMYEYIYKVKSYISNTIRYLYKTNSDFINSMMLGQKDDLSQNEKLMFTRTGTSHIIAISGLHTGILSGLIIFMMGKINKIYKLIVLSTMMFIYSAMVGNSPSIIRAIMFMISLYLSFFLDRKMDKISTLSFIGILFVINNPYIIYNISFQLSFLATLSIIYFYGYINNKLNIKIISLTLSANILTIPIIYYNFEGIPLVSILGNIIIVPFVGIIIYLAMLSLILFNINIYISSIVVYINRFILETIYVLLERISNLDFAYIAIEEPKLYYVIIYYIVVFLYMIYKEAKTIKEQSHELQGYYK